MRFKDIREADYEGEVIRDPAHTVPPGGPPKVTPLPPQLYDKAERVIPSELKKAASLVAEHCSSAFSAAQEGNIIWRGVKGHFPDFMLADSDKGQARKSANTQNYYTLVIDNSAEWAKFPKRSRSFICSVDISNASRYGSAYAVFPYDYTKIGVCPDQDIWASFGRSSDYFGFDRFSFDLESLNSRLHKMLYAARVVKVGHKPETTFNVDADIQTLQTELEEARKTIVANGFTSAAQLFNAAADYAVALGFAFAHNMNVAEPFIKSPMLHEPNGLWKWLENGLRPGPNDFHVIPIEQFDYNYSKLGEVWFQGKAVFVRKLQVQEFLPIVQKMMNDDAS